MFVNLSPAQIGVLCACLEQSGQSLCSLPDIEDIVFSCSSEVREVLGPVFYDLWVEEYNLKYAR